MTEETLARIEEEVLHGELPLQDDTDALIAEIRRCWSVIEELKRSQGVSPKMFDDPCLGYAGNPEV